MNDRKKLLRPILCAVASAGFLIAAVVAPVVKGEPLNYTFLTFAFMFFTFAAFFFALGRKSGGGSGPSSA